MLAEEIIKTQIPFHYIYLNLKTNKIFIKKKELDIAFEIKGNWIWSKISGVCDFLLEEIEILGINEVEKKEISEIDIVTKLQSEV